MGIAEYDTNISNTFSSASDDEKKIWDLLEQVSDPEVPVLSIVDLGILRKVQVSTNADTQLPVVEITVTPTYSGCPAIDMISINIRMALLQSGYKEVVIKQTLSPAWTTDWMSEKGKQKLKAYGIAPPVGRAINEEYLEDITLECPNCRSLNTQLISTFGSTSCKALFKCNDCKEPFDYFKCH